MFKSIQEINHSDYKSFMRDRVDEEESHSSVRRCKVHSNVVLVSDGTKHQ